MKNSLTILKAALAFGVALFAVPALAQGPSPGPGPQPVPDPWVVSGNQIKPNAGQQVQFSASTTGQAAFNIPCAVAPTSPANGDMWCTSSALFARVNGTTVNLSAGGGSSGSAGLVQLSNGSGGFTTASGFSAVTPVNGVGVSGEVLIGPRVGCTGCSGTDLVILSGSTPSFNNFFPGGHSTMIGDFARADGINHGAGSVAVVSEGGIVTQNHCTVIGNAAICAGQSSVVIGLGANVGVVDGTNPDSGTAVGHGATVLAGAGDVAIGSGATAGAGSGGGSVAIGHNAQVQSGISIAIGDNANADGVGTIAIGRNAVTHTQKHAVFGGDFITDFYAGLDTAGNQVPGHLANLFLNGPTTKTADYNAGASQDSSLVFNCSGACVITLPGPGDTGRVMMLKTIAAQTLSSLVNNIIQLDGSGPTSAILPATAGSWAIIQWDANSHWQIIAAGGPGSGGSTLTANSTLTSGYTSGQIVYSDGSKIQAASVTGTLGSVVLSNSPALVTPNLGTPSAAVLTNATGLPIAGITGLGTGVGTALAAGVTGTGDFVLAAAPTLTGLTTVGSLNTKANGGGAGGVNVSQGGLRTVVLQGGTSGGAFFSNGIGECWTSSNDAAGSPDTCFYRDSPGVVDLGNSTFQDKSGTLKLANLVASNTIQPKGFLVSTLPGSPPQGSIAFVTDAVACTFLATLTGGAGNYCPVTFNGSAWVGG